MKFPPQGTKHFKIIVHLSITDSVFSFLCKALCTRLLSTHQAISGSLLPSTLKSWNTSVIPLTFTVFSSKQSPLTALSCPKTWSLVERNRGSSPPVWWLRNLRPSFQKAQFPGSIYAFLQAAPIDVWCVLSRNTNLRLPESSALTGTQKTTYNWKIQQYKKYYDICWIFFLSKSLANSTDDGTGKMITTGHNADKRCSNENYYNVGWRHIGQATQRGPGKSERYFRLQCLKQESPYFWKLSRKLRTCFSMYHVENVLKMTN